jgi:beta-glucosidase
MGKELRALGGNYFGGVCVNLAPNPKWGRLQESYGEDPLLVGSFGAALSKGVSKNAIACVKHFALNSMENQRFTVNVECAEDVLHECYLPHFRQTLEEGGAESIMSAYNSVNGEFCGDNKDLLNGVVRDTWGYDDVIITSDWLWGTRDAPKSIAAGLDVEMPLRSVRAFHLQKALLKDKADWAHVHTIVRRLLRAQLKFYSRIDGTPEPSAESIPGCVEHTQLAKRVAAEGMILLQNSAVDGQRPILPLKTQRRILVVGELAASKQTGDKGSSALSDVTTITPLDGIKAQAGTHVTYLDGKDLTAVEKASAHVDVVFCLVGYSGVDEGEYVTSTDPELLTKTFPFVFHHLLVAKAFTYVADKAASIYAAIYGGLPGGDRSSLRLRPADECLVSALADYAGSKLILGIESSGPVILPKSVREKTATILHTGYAGCQFGNALREVLFGEAEAAGRLAYGYVESELDIASIDMNATSVRYDRFWGYRLAQQRNDRPAYPFGFGLGYGRFELDIGKIQKLSTIDERFFTIEVAVQNQGEHSSSDVVQIYGGKACEFGTPDHSRVLLGFARTRYLGQGDRQTLQVQCRLDPLARWNSAAGGFDVDQGKYAISVSHFEGDPQSITQTVEVCHVHWSAKTELRQEV